MICDSVGRKKTLDACKELLPPHDAELMSEYAVRCFIAGLLTALEAKILRAEPASIWDGSFFVPESKF